MAGFDLTTHKLQSLHAPCRVYVPTTSVR
jgi:hypothetical protein